MLASDIMTPDVITIAPDADIADAVSLMLTHRISALPVVRNGAVVGILSEGDLLRRAETGTEPSVSLPDQPPHPERKAAADGTRALHDRPPAGSAAPSTATT